MTDEIRALLAQMAKELDNYLQRTACDPKVVHPLATRARAVLAAEPPAPAVGPEWRPCVKLPITVHVRDQRPGEAHVSTREGITPVRPDDLIMRGVQGEEYPIGRDLFNRTYRLGAADPGDSAPAPAGHVPDAGDMVAADEEWEELAAWLDEEAKRCAAQFYDRITRAAALLREARPQPVPGWQPIDTAPQDGTEILASDYDAIEVASWDAWAPGSGWIDRNGQRLFPAWWQPLPDHPPIPQPPQANTTHPTPTEPPTND